MRYLYIYFAITSAFLLVEGAVMLHKRVAPNIEACVQDMNAIIPELDSQQPFIRAAQVFETRHAYEMLRNVVLEAQLSCCDIIDVVSEEDALYYLNSEKTVNARTLSLLSLLRDKVDDFNFLVKIIVNTQIQDLNQLTTDLYACFVAFTPQEQLNTLQYSIDDLKTSFNLTIDAYSTIF